ncbi:C40 family peptidase [Alicyclobacillus fastidiosus]|uniref:C40 family peptidase n=1 Tax=Alicyclobacillus fastidiosus TaxID=392011 RepID=A0ABV5A9F4_9BACL|nr:C40 family peptidase [Alicyclobacillus fastidiosus]WEH10770.1 C40 family peptidase [Alicyclobacillus fastidiosus]
MATASLTPVVFSPSLTAAAVKYKTVAHAGHLPPGVKHVIVKGSAFESASWQTKYNAVLRVAKSKLGTPYRWGHNEDRGQYGFDCSNYTEYVYHHALGYKFSTSSKVQGTSVGWKVAKADMRPGDLLIFDNGKHVGIYIGNNEMIQEGGGAGKVAYMKVGKGYYWHNHLTAVKRMF